MKPAGLHTLAPGMRGFLIALAAGRGDPLTHAVQAEATAQVANAVTGHAAELAEAAREALVHAHDVLAQTRKVGLPEKIDGQLEKAESALVAATRKAEVEQLEQAQWLEGAVATQQLENGEGGAAFDKLEAQVDVVAQRTHEDLGDATDAELKQELDALKQKLAQQRQQEAASAKTGHVEYADVTAEVQALKGRLTSIKHQLKVLSDQEAAAGGASSDAEPARKNLAARADALEKQLSGLTEDDDDKIDDLEDQVDKLEADVAAEVMEEDLELGGESGPGANSPSSTPVQSSGPDVDTNMPFGELSSFGREDTAQELTDASLRESDLMVDQIEKAQVAEEKRAVFRALTRLRGAAISSFDGIARAQTGNIDEYTHSHKWRNNHPLHHLADEESDVHKWAFPADADLVQAKVRRSKAAPQVASEMFLSLAP